MVIFWDIEGNELFNAPLAWIAHTVGILKHSITDMETFGNSISWNVSFQILQDNGNVITIPTYLVLLYRALQYTIWFVIVGYINEKTFIKLALKTKNTNKQDDMVDDEITGMNNKY